MLKGKINLLSVEVDGITYRQIMPARRENGLPLFLIENPNSLERYKLTLAGGVGVEESGFDSIQLGQGINLDLGVDVMTKKREYLEELVRAGVKKIIASGRTDIREMTGFLITQEEGRARLTYCKYVKIGNN